MSKILGKLLRNTKSWLRHNKPLVKEGKFGITYLIIPNSALDSHITEKGIFGDWIAKLDSGIFGRKSIAMDIGANVGLITMVMAKKIFSSGRVFAYEPDYQNFGQLAINSDLNKLDNLQIFPVAIQDNPNRTTTKFNIRRAVDGDGKENRGLSSILNIGLHHIKFCEVFTSTIDREVKRLNLNRLDFIKIDVEGAEYKVISGGLTSIKKFRPVIQYEYSVVLDSITKLNSGAKSFRILDDLGYKQYAIKGELLLEHLENPKIIDTDINILAIPKEKKTLMRILTKNEF